MLPHEHQVHVDVDKTFYLVLTDHVCSIFVVKDHQLRQYLVWFINSIKKNMFFTHTWHNLYKILSHQLNWNEEKANGRLPWQVSHPSSSLFSSPFSSPSTVTLQVKMLGRSSHSLPNTFNLICREGGTTGPLGWGEMPTVATMAYEEQVNHQPNY